MTPEQWRRIEALYHAARELAEPDRHAFLSGACAGDEALRREVESLLAQPASAEGVLDGPAAAVAAQMVSDIGASVVTGRRFGAYHVHERLGAGGMGEVYRARDTQLGRDVAIKILPRAFTRDAERLARFEREARMLAALNHPHISAIYGLEAVDGVPALVLELVEGETLAERLVHRPLAIAEALRVAQQIADALNAAHEKGIIHRDLKPANIKITPEDVVKVLDFGLAKVLAGDAPGLVQSPTTGGGSRQGVILGTAAYMSPEQARGQPVDKRTDIWAFGCVLFEMLTGTATFPGATVSDTLAAILEHEPAWSRLPAATPSTVRRLLQRCLDKDPKRRLRDVGDARMDIDEALLGNSAAGAVAPHRPNGAWLPWTVAAAFFAVSAALAGVVFFGFFSATAREGAATPRGTKITFAVPTPNNLGMSLSLSPDGKNIADTVQSGTVAMLWVQALEDQMPRFLPGTDFANNSFWSPDGRSIGFFAGGKLRTVGISGAPLRTLCDVWGGSGGTWNVDGVIVFAPTPNGPLYRVTASGGTPVQVTELDQSRQEESHRHPMFLPDGHHFLYTAVSSKADETLVIYVGSLDSKNRKRLIDSVERAVFARPNRVLFARDGFLMAQPFDPNRLEMTGEEFAIADGVGRNPGSSTAFTASQTGVVAYRAGVIAGVVPGRLEWLDRSGKKIAEVGAPATYWSPALSPDLHSVAVHREEGARDLWIFDLVRGTNSRLTFDAGDDDDPVWSPDGSRIIFSSLRAGRRDLYIKNSTSASQEELLLESDAPKRPGDWSRDGRFLLYTHVEPKTLSDIWVLPLAGDRKPEPVIQTRFSEVMPRFSPDGRYIAYISTESGRHEVYVQSFPVSGRKWQISTNTGVQPMWRGDGRELFFISLTNDVMAVPVSPSKDGGLEVGVPQKLFTALPTIVYGARNAWTVAPDGQRFLIVNAVGGTNVAPITVVVNWDQEQGR